MPRVLRELRDSFIKLITLAKHEYWQHTWMVFNGWRIHVQINVFDNILNSFIITMHPDENWPPKIGDPPVLIYQISGSYENIRSEKMRFAAYGTLENHLVFKHDNIKTPLRFKKKIFDEIGLKLSDLKDLPALIRLEAVKMV